MSKLGGLAVLNLEGVQTRYKNPQEVLQKIVETDKSEITGLLQKIYQEPVQQEFDCARIRQIKDGGALAAVSSIPQRAVEFGCIAQERGSRRFCCAKYGLDRAVTFLPNIVARSGKVLP